MFAKQLDYNLKQNSYNSCSLWEFSLCCFHLKCSNVSLIVRIPRHSVGLLLCAQLTSYRIEYIQSESYIFNPNIYKDRTYAMWHLFWYLMNQNFTAIFFWSSSDQYWPNIKDILIWLAKLYCPCGMASWRCCNELSKPPVSDWHSLQTLHLFTNNAGLIDYWFDTITLKIR